MLKEYLRRGSLIVLGLLLITCIFVSLPTGSEVIAKPIQACATVSDLGSLLKDVGGDQVSVTVFTKGKEDPHFLEAKPSFIKALSRADLYVQIGMELEVGYAPVLLQNARNGRVLPGAPGYIDASAVIAPLEIATGPVDRSMGDIHPLGNPHYLADPLNGLKVARLIKDKLTEQRPEKRQLFEERYSAFQRKLDEALVGEKLAKKYDSEKISPLFEQGKIVPFLKEQKEEGSLGGWLGMMLPYLGSKVVSDHNLWPYFSRRFRISIGGFLEPKPGLSPTTKHLQALIEMMRVQGIKVILTSPYFDIRHAQFVAKNTGAKIALMAHQAGSRPGTDDYVSLIDYNVRQLVTALGGRI